MTLTQLSYIVALYKFKNFGLAAENCKVTQPTLSMQIQKLEDELGATLFDRSQHPIVATPIGKKLVDQARIILNEAQRFNDILKDSMSDVSGEVTIGVIPTLAPYLLPLFIKTFGDRHSKLQINVEELQTHQILDRIKTSSIDMAILATPIEGESLSGEVLFYEPFKVYTSEKNTLYGKVKIQQSDLSLSELWLLSEGHCFRDQSLAVCKSRKKTTDENRNISFESGSFETLKKMVDQENGFTLLPLLATLDVKNQKQLKDFQQPVPTREISLVHSPFFKRDALKASLIEAIQKSLPKEIAQITAKNSQVIDLPKGNI